MVIVVIARDIFTNISNPCDFLNAGDAKNVAPQVWSGGLFSGKTDLSAAPYDPPKWMVEVVVVVRAIALVMVSRLFLLYFHVCNSFTDVKSLQPNATTN